MNLRIRDAHPRVLIRPDDLPALRRRAATTHSKEFQSLQALAFCEMMASMASGLRSIRRNPTGEPKSCM